jgi:hypothetical protein
VRLALLRLRGLQEAIALGSLRSKKRVKRAIKRVLKAVGLMRPER